MTGRPLDIGDPTQCIEGDTQPIYVSRENLFDDAMEEILAESPPPIWNVPLDVTFYGEQAQDFGGPRREFLTLMLHEVRDRLFEDTGNGYDLAYSDAHFTRRHYYAAGVITGL